MEPQGLGCGVWLSKPSLRVDDQASMEPQGLGCGVIRGQFFPRSASFDSFNGATGFRLWSPFGQPLFTACWALLQ